MKFSIDVHKEHLKNRESHLKRERENVQHSIKRLDVLETSVALFRAQVDLAVKEKKDGFDEERYAIKRLCV